MGKNVTEEKKERKVWKYDICNPSQLLTVFPLGTENTWVIEHSIGGFEGHPMPSAGARMRKTVVTQNSSLYNTQDALEFVNLKKYIYKKWAAVPAWGGG